MLSEDEKKRIHLEEEYRHELRQQFEKQISKKTKWGKGWEFINSAFFLWFLSTIVIGVVSFLYASWEKQKEVERREYEQELLIKREKEVTTKKLDAEISSRLGYFGAIISVNAITGQDYPIEKAILILDKPSEADYPVNVFPEYAARSLRSLVWELLQTVPENEKKELEEAYDATKRIPAQARLFLINNPLKRYTRKTPSGLNEVDAQRDERTNVYYGVLQTLYIHPSLNLKRWGEPLGQWD